VTVRIAALLWLLLGVGIWNGFFDLYVSRGAREYLQRKLEYETGRGPEPSMHAVMGAARRDGLVMASIWSVLVVGGGWVTLWWSTKRSGGAG
jgi:hypothetical protein